MKNRYGLLSTLAAILLFVLLEVVSIVMAANNGAVQRFKLLGAVRNVEGFFWSRTSSLGNFFNYKSENEKLAEENLKLRQELERCSAIIAAADSLDVKVMPDFTFIGARVIRNTVNSQHNHIILDRGSKDGVEQGMGVITSRGVIGIVGAVSRRYSYVFSLLGTGQSVSAKLAGSGTFGPMIWDGGAADKATLSEIPVHVKASPGDTIVTSGFSTVYPADIPIGLVTGSSVSRGSSQEISVKLLEDFRSLNHVYIVRNNNAEELRELYEQAD